MCARIAQSAGPPPVLPKREEIYFTIDCTIQSQIVPSPPFGSTISAIVVPSAVADFTICAMIVLSVVADFNICAVIMPHVEISLSAP